MKLLLTSNGLSNASIATALADLTGKNPKDAKVAFIPTAAHTKRENKNWLIDDLYRIKQQGYYVDILELTALQPKEVMRMAEGADVLFAGGGNVFFLSYWMQKTGLFDRMPKLLETKVYAGISAGSILAGGSLLPSKAVKDGYVDERYYEKNRTGESSDKPLGLVDLIVRPHLNSPYFPLVNKSNLAKIAPTLPYPLYALDDNSALKIIDERIEVVTEGEYFIANGARPVTS